MFSPLSTSLSPSNEPLRFLRDQKQLSDSLRGGSRWSGLRLVRLDILFPGQCPQSRKLFLRLD